MPEMMIIVDFSPMMIGVAALPRYGFLAAVASYYSAAIRRRPSADRRLLIADHGSF